MSMKISNAYGSVTVSQDTDIWIIHNLSVNKQHRGQGHGKRLLELAILYIRLRKSEKSSVGLWVKPSEEAALSFNDLLRFYTNFGFCKTKYVGWLEMNL